MMTRPHNGLQEQTMSDSEEVPIRNGVFVVRSNEGDTPNAASEMSIEEIRALKLRQIIKERENE